MWKKLRAEAGLSMIETLAAVFILILLALMMGTGLQMMTDTYQTMIAQSEVELLLSDAVDALADHLRNAWNVQVDTTGSDPYANFTYNSNFYEEPIRLKLDSNGRIVTSDSTGIGTENGILPTGSYGSSGAIEAYKYKDYEISRVETAPGTYEKLVDCTVSGSEVTFTIQMTVSTEDGKISASTPEGGVKIRCLNPKL